MGSLQGICTHIFLTCMLHDIYTSIESYSNRTKKKEFLTDTFINACSGNRNHVL